jgi:anti-sigma factor RsiW
MPAEKVNPLLLERFVLGELPADQLAAMRARVEGDPELQAAVAEIEADNRAVLIAHPPAAVAEAVRQRVGKPVKKSAPWLWLVPAVGMAALGSWALSGNDSTALRLEEPDTTRVKGSPQLIVHRQKGKEAEALANGAAARAGDVLQLSYVAAGAAYGAVVSIDGNGATTLHFPATQDGPTRLLSHAALEAAYELDAAPRFERFFLVTSAAPIDVSKVMERAHALAVSPNADSAALSVSPEIKETSVLLRKQP